MLKQPAKSTIHESKKFRIGFREHDKIMSHAVIFKLVMYISVILQTMHKWRVSRTDGVYRETSDKELRSLRANVKSGIEFIDKITHV